MPSDPAPATGEATPQPPEPLAALAWVLWRVERHLERFGFRLVGQPGRPADAHASVAEARAVLAGRLGAPVAAELGLLPDSDGTPPPEPGTLPGRFARLAALFGLSAVERRLFVAAAAPALSVDLARLYTFAWSDFTRKQPSAGFLAELVCDDPAETLAAHRAFRPGATLVRNSLLRVSPTEAWAPDPPLIHRGVTVPEPVLAWIRGEPMAPPAFLLARLGTLATPTGEPETTAAAQGRLDAALRNALGRLDGHPRIVVLGPVGSGRRSAVARAAHRHQSAVVALRLGGLAPDRVVDALRCAGREARLREQVLMVLIDGTLTPDGRAGLSATLRGFADRHEGPLVIALERPETLDGLPEPRVEVTVSLPPTARQTSLWREALDVAGLTHDAGLPQILAEQFSLTPHTIRSAARELGDTLRAAPDAPLRPAVDRALLAEIVHRHSGHALGDLAEPVRTTLGWDDVVLPHEVLERLHEIRAHARHRAQVFDAWGFRRKLSYGRGLTCLFAGPPGTGKTMMAGILARDVGQVMYRVDLSRVVSKWVGETEKNLARVFDEAARAQVILFFDEADSLFSKRTDVQSSNDRFANMEVNYLLQRMEQYDGMSILTTNFEHGLDEAFKRRLRFRVHFTLPDVSERAELWQRMIPPEMPRDEELPFRLLARRFKMSGGNIKNAVLRAAFYAAEGEQRLTAAHLVRGAENEMVEMGRL